MRQPEWNRRFQALAAQLIAGEPDVLQRFQQCLGLIFPFGAGPLGWRGTWLCFAIQ